MSYTLRLFNYLFIVVLLLSCLLALIVILYTLLDLSYNSYFDLSSKESIDRFISSFSWGKLIIGNSIVMFSAYYLFQSYKVQYEDKLYNNYIVHKEKSLNEKLLHIKLSNKKMHDFLIKNSREIMWNIISTENNNRVGNKKKLEYYFNRFIKREIRNFECSQYYGKDCIIDCTNCPYRNKKLTNSHSSFSSFKLFSFDLFCVSYLYTEFEEDIRIIYQANIHKSN